MTQLRRCLILCRYDRLDRWLLGSVPFVAHVDEAEGERPSALRGGPAGQADTSRMLLLLAPAGLVGVYGLPNCPLLSLPHGKCCC